MYSHFIIHAKHWNIQDEKQNDNMIKTLQIQTKTTVHCIVSNVKLECLKCVFYDQSFIFVLKKFIFL